MSLRRVLEALESFGLSSLESEVYVYLAKAGPSEVEELTLNLRMPTRQLHAALTGLRNRGIVSNMPERTALYSAVAFSELVNRYVKSNVEQAEMIIGTKQELLDSWRNMFKEKIV